MAIPNTKLEAARLIRRWSIEVAAGKVGVSPNTLHRWERGLQFPQLETLDLLCTAFEMSPEELGFDQVIAAKRRPRLLHEGQDNSTRGLKGPGQIQRCPPTAPPPDLSVEGSTWQTLPPVERPAGLILPEGDRARALKRLLEVLAEGTRTGMLVCKEVLELYAVVLWELYRLGMLDDLGRLLGIFEALLRQCPQEHLRTQCRLLSSLFHLHAMDFGNADEVLEQIQRSPCDDPLQIAVLLQQGILARVQRQFFACSTLYSQLWQSLSSPLPQLPLLKASLAALLAEVLFASGQKGQAQEWEQHLQAILPTLSKEDEADSYFTLCTHWRLAIVQADLALHKGQPIQALACMQQVIPHAGLEEVEGLLLLARIRSQLGPTPQCAAALRQAAARARVLQSRWYEEQACSLFEHCWKRLEPDHPEVVALLQLFWKQAPMP